VEKEKGPLAKARRPQKWAPTLPTPNRTAGVVTWAKSVKIVSEDVVGFGADDGDFTTALKQATFHFSQSKGANCDKIFFDMPLPECQHLVGNMETINVNL